MLSLIHGVSALLQINPSLNFVMSPLCALVHCDGIPPSSLASILSK